MVNKLKSVASYADDKENQTTTVESSRISKRKMNIKNEPCDQTEPLSSKPELSNSNTNKKVDIKIETTTLKQEFAQTSKYFAQDPEPESKKTKWEPPAWKEQLERIREMRSEQNAPVDTAGCSSLANVGAKTPKDKRFCVLVSLMLSAQTKDEVTAKAVSELEKLPLTLDSMLNTDEKVIARAIYPASFYKVIISFYSYLNVQIFNSPIKKNVSNL
jgi:endonuclease-3